MKRVFVVNVEVTDEDWNYFDACARLRDVALSSLARMVLETAINDQMIPSILDDDLKRPRYARHYQGGSPFRQGRGKLR